VIVFDPGVAFALLTAATSDAVSVAGNVFALAEPTPTNPTAAAHTTTPTSPRHTTPKLMLIPRLRSSRSLIARTPTRGGVTRADGIALSSRVDGLDQAMPSPVHSADTACTQVRNRMRG
jgi:hypothetical protein